MTKTVLGVSAFYHDSAAALVQDGRVIAAAQEERFSRIKNDPRFPRQAINYCLEEGFVEAEDLDAVVFYDDPALSFDRIIKSILSNRPPQPAQWVRVAPAFLGVKLDFANHIRDMLKCKVPVFNTRHHLAHAASAFYPSPFEESAILTIDGVGEWATTTLGRGMSSEIEILKEVQFPHSLGLLYSAFTYFCGFRVNSGEYKLMGLAPYGQPIYENLIRDHLIAVKPDGSYRLNMDYFGFLETDSMTNARFHALFGGAPRVPESRITRRERDLAASIQKVVEDLVVGLARHVQATTGSPNLCLAGGVALNCVANGVLHRTGLFERIWIQPAAGDAGGALGAALIGSHSHLGVPRHSPAENCDSQEGSYLGPRYSRAEIQAFLERNDYPCELVEDPGIRARKIATALDAGRIVGFMSGRMEFGPRALGARSIIGDPRRPETQTEMNLRTKFRESFRPFAPAVLEEHCASYFEFDEASPYMMFVAPVKPERCLDADPLRLSEDGDLMEVIRQPRSDIPAVTHVDYSARLQTVDGHSHPEFRRVLEAFYEQTGCPVLVNTSFNVRGEPIVCTPRDAYVCFMRTNIDLLVMEEFVLEKAEQPKAGSGLTAANPFESTPRRERPMSWLVMHAERAQMQAFFTFHLKKSAEAVDRLGRKFFPMGADSAPTWYVEAEGGLPAVLKSGEDDLERLKKIWESQGLTELVSLIEPLKALQKRIRKSAHMQPFELSASLYVMY